MTPKKTWILVADAGRARVLQQLDHEPDLTLIEGFDLDHPLGKTSDTARDSLPRTFDSTGHSRHAIAPRTDPHRAEKRSFAHDLAAALDEALVLRAFDHLVIVAPPQMLGDLRAAFSDHVKGRLTRELHLDLAHAPVHEIARRLKEAA